MRGAAIVAAIIFMVMCVFTFSYAEEKFRAPAQTVSKDTEIAAGHDDQKEAGPDNVGLEKYGVNDPDEAAEVETYDENTGLKDAVQSDSQW